MFATKGQLRTLLRAHRPNDGDYPLSGSPEELLSSVRELFYRRLLRRRSIDGLLERAEENGRQHIYLYTTTTKAAAARLNDFASVEAALLDGQTREEAGLPRFQVRPDGVAIADLRLERRPGTTYYTWIYKLYAGAYRWQQTRIVERDDEKIVTYTRHYIREVVVVKWHSFGLLELRLPVGRTKMQLQDLRVRILRTLNEKLDLENTEARTTGGVTVDDLAEFFRAAQGRRAAEMVEHPPGMQALVPLHIPACQLNDEARQKSVSWISVNSSEYEVDGHNIHVDADDENDNLYDSRELVTALKPLRDCTRFNAFIHIKEQPDLPEKLSVEFCPNLPNEFRIGGHTTPETIEFIVRRIWERARPQELPPSPVDAIGDEVGEGAILAALDIQALERRFPTLINAIRRIYRWAQDHRSAEVLDARHLRRSLGKGIPATDMAAAVAKLVSEGVLERRLQVRPQGRRKPLPHFFRTEDELLDADIKDEEGNLVDLANADIRPVYSGKAER